MRLQSAFRKLYDLHWRLLSAISDHIDVGPISLRTPPGCNERQSIIDRVAAALDFLEQHDHDLYRDVSANLTAILVTEASGAQYIAGLDACRIGRLTVLRSTPLRLAMFLVHEAKHAELRRSGLDYRLQNRSAIEKQCVQAEVDFAKKVSGSEAEIAWTESLLEKEWWTPESIRQNSKLEAARLGLPGWILRLFRL